MFEYLFLIKLVVVVNKGNLSCWSSIDTQVKNIKTVVMAKNIMHLFRLDAMNPENAEFFLVSNSSTFGTSSRKASFISCEMVEHETMVNSFPSNECAAARILIASAIS